MHWTSRSKLGKYLKKFDIGTSRRNTLSAPVQVQHVLHATAKDPAQSWGPRNVKEKLAFEGVHIAR
jgi:hypothetical protein